MIFKPFFDRIKAVMIEKSVKKQVKSKERVADFGEVFTAEREVNAMLDLVKDESYRIEATFLEPACGDGNFLIKILKRKIETVNKLYKKNTLEYDRYILRAVMSCYGIELLEDNTLACRERLYNLATSFVSDEDIMKDIKFVLDLNIVNGDALTFTTIDGEPIVFSEWVILENGLVKREDFNFKKLVDTPKKTNNGTEMLLDMLPDDDPFFITKPIKKYKLVHCKRLYMQNEQN